MKKLLKNSWIFTPSVKMKFILLLVLMSFSTYGAVSSLPCGVYEVHGKVIKNPETLEVFYLVNEGTLSQYKFSVENKQKLQLLPYEGRSTKLKATIFKEVINYQGEFNRIEDISLALPDPARMLNTPTVSLVKKDICK